MKKSIPVWRPALAALVIAACLVEDSPAQMTSAHHAPTGEFRAPTPSARFRVDPLRNNLVHPPGYATVPLGSLGEVVERGRGETPVILIAGLGNSWRVFEKLIAANEKTHRFFAVTLAGYGGSSAPPMPPAPTSFAERMWLGASQRAVRDLILGKKLDRPLIVSFFSEATNIALRLALEEPERVGGVLALTSSLRFPIPPQAGDTDRGAVMDQFANQWFKGVTEVMWPSGMFTPDSYANETDVSEKAWWEALQPSIPTAVRYMVEGWADDLVDDLAKIEVPVIALSPGFDEEYMSGMSGMQIRTRFHDTWGKAVEGGSSAEHRIVENARFLVWEDQPRAVKAALRDLGEKREASMARR